MLAAYPLYYICWVYQYKSWGENASTINIPNTVYFLMLCAGVLCYTLKDWNIILSRIVSINYLGYLLIFLTDAVYRWNDKINTLYSVVLISLTALLCVIYLLYLAACSVITRY